MDEESEDSYQVLFFNLKKQRMFAPKFVISDAHAGLTATIRKSFPRTSWQRCRGILYSEHSVLKEIWLSTPVKKYTLTAGDPTA